MHTAIPGQRQLASPDVGRRSDIRSILVVTDPSASHDIALARARQLAAQHRAALTVLRLPARDSRDELVRATQDADLVVVGDPRSSALAAWLQGQPAQQLMRRSACPVLVVRNAPQGPYARILATVDFSARSRAVVEAAAGLDAHAELELFHAVSTRQEARLRQLQVHDEVVDRWRQDCLRAVRNRLVSLTSSYDTRRNRVLASIGHGEIARQAAVQQEHSGADLVAIGSRRQSRLGELLHGNTAWRLARACGADVLAVPVGPPQAPVFEPAQRVGAMG